MSRPSDNNPREGRHSGAAAPPGRARAILISAFVIAWNLVFHYESLRANYLDSWLHERLQGSLPKLKLLFPPAGWIMFFRVDDADGRAEVIGVTGPGQGEVIDPHLIFETRWLGYDNIHRNVMISTLNGNYAPSFCRYLRRKFPDYQGFLVMQVWTPSITKEPARQVKQLAYRCP